MSIDLFDTGDVQLQKDNAQLLVPDKPFKNGYFVLFTIYVAGALAIILQLTDFDTIVDP